jgi:lysylphosphatidylglycerol synthetase-like protein (DUF2156 family)
MDQPSRSSTEAGLSTSGPAPSPRAFAIGTGAVFQTVGGLWTTAAIVVAIISVWVIPKTDQPVEQWAHFFQTEHRASALWTILLATSWIGGLAMVAVGVGLQGERKNSGRVAMVTCAVMGLCFSGVAIAFLVRLGRIGPAIVAAGLAALSLGGFMLAGHCAAVLRMHPPPADLHVATPEILEEFRQKRLERLKKFEP